MSSKLRFCFGLGRLSLDDGEPTVPIAGRQNVDLDGPLAVVLDQDADILPSGLLVLRLLPFSTADRKSS